MRLYFCGGAMNEAREGVFVDVVAMFFFCFFSQVHLFWLVLYVVFEKGSAWCTLDRDFHR